MASYSVLTSESTIQVLSPTVVVDAYTATVQTDPTGIVATLTFPNTFFESATAGDLLQAFATNIEAFVSGGKVSGAIGGQVLDANGLLQDTVDFTVSYTPPNSPTGPLTAQVEVPSNDLVGIVGPTTYGNLAEAEYLINTAYNNLILLSGGTPPATTSGSGSGSGSGTPPPPITSP